MNDPYLDSVLEAIARDALDGDGPRLITVDELRAAGALDVPPAWRKSLGADDELSTGRDGTLPLFAGLSDAVADTSDSSDAADPRQS